jgi:hypothetical protein
MKIQNWVRTIRRWVRTSPERFERFLEGFERSPERFEPLPERFERSPERLERSPERLERSSGRFERSRESLERFSGRFERFLRGVEGFPRNRRMQEEGVQTPLPRPSRGATLSGAAFALRRPHSKSDLPAKGTRAFSGRPWFPFCRVVFFQRMLRAHRPLWKSSDCWLRSCSPS